MIKKLESQKSHDTGSLKGELVSYHIAGGREAGHAGGGGQAGQALQEERTLPGILSNQPLPTYLYMIWKQYWINQGCGSGAAAGLRIRSIFIRILQIRILKSDPDPGSYWH